MSDLGPQLVRHPRFRWMEGMIVDVAGDRYRLTEYAEHRCTRLSGDGLYREVAETRWYGHKEGNRSFTWVVPIPFHLAEKGRTRPGWWEDPATMGCLRALLREVHAQGALPADPDTIHGVWTSEGVQLTPAPWQEPPEERVAEMLLAAAGPSP